MKAASRATLIRLQSQIAWCIDAAADRTGNDRRLASLLDTIERQEREHRAFGRRLVGSHATKGRAPVRAAVNHFLCKVVHEGLSTYRCGEVPIASLKGIRDDYVMGAILCSDRAFVDALVSYVRERFPDEAPTDAIARAAAVDYCEAIVPEARS